MTSIEQLPDELLAHILRVAGYSSNLHLVCHRWNEVFCHSFTFEHKVWSIETAFKRTAVCIVDVRLYNQRPKVVMCCRVRGARPCSHFRSIRHRLTTGLIRCKIARFELFFNLDCMRLSRSFKDV